LRKRKKIKKTTVNIPKDTMIGLYIGIATFAFLLLSVIYSTFKRGNAGLGVGIVGVIVMIVSGFGLLESIRGIRKKDCMYYTVPIISIGVNGIIFVFTFLLYIIGIFL